MTELHWLVLLAFFVLAWIGHAYLWISLLSNLYGRAISRRFLKFWRVFSGVVILAFPAILYLANVGLYRLEYSSAGLEPLDGIGLVALGYFTICLVFGALVLPAITVRRLLRKPAACVVSHSTRTLDLWTELGPAVVGDGHLAFTARLPLNCLFRVDFTELTLALPDLPPTWDGLTILALSDLHFHGTPARVFFERIIDELAAHPSDVLCLLGDYVDTHTHHDWIQPLLGRLTATEAKLAILGNHDLHHDPARVRTELAAAGYAVLGNGWREVTIRGVPCVVVGHEGPWFAPGPDLSAAPPEPFRLCLSHTPDNFYWGIANRIGLMLCGHVHGGAIRLPVIGSLFVPSIYGRRFDCGVFDEHGTAMAVNRGVSGKEPLRFRCNPQILRVTLVRRPRTSS